MPDATITYFHHNCFCLELGGRTMLFDYPSSAHRPEGVEARVRKKLDGADAYIFLSHSHQDHCSAEIVELAKVARTTRYVLSFDVPDLVPRLALDGAAVVDPDEGPVAVGDLSVSGLEATDLGVAFLIDAPEARIYFGGDLAEWAWPALDERALDAEVRYFEGCLEKIKAFDPQIVFTNADTRLVETRGGVSKLLEAVGPQVLIPIHLFGQTDTLLDLADQLSLPGTGAFIYRQLGDSLVVPLD